jgi:hypothetical protein
MLNVVQVAPSGKSRFLSGRSNKILLFMFFLSTIFILGSSTKADDLNTARMEKATKEILEIFKSTTSDRSKNLKKYISGEWIDRKNINMKDFKINTYAPDHYSILTSSGDICIASIGGESWEHLLIFKFTEEDGMYKVVPKGISKSSSDFIDPWCFVKEYVCKSTDKDEK